MIMPRAAATFMVSTGPATDGARHISMKESRKRAPKACLQCRRRKVRCDVVFSGSPCRNCVLDDMRCVVTKRKLKSQSFICDNYDSSFLASATPHSPAIVGDSAAQTVDNPPGDICGLEADMIPGVPSFAEGLGFLDPPGINLMDGPLSGDFFPDRDMFLAPGIDHPLSLYDDDDYHTSNLPFIKLPDFSNMPLQEISSLRLQGCLRLPPRLILDEFVRQYFLHVHPVVPLLDEGRFWDSYSRKTAPVADSEKIPLVLFQAMLFSACSFISQPIVEALGFNNLRSASAKLYSKAKMLYDLKTESSPLVLSQAAILLTFLPLSFGVGPKRPNSRWLEIAVDHARSAHTDHILDTCHGSSDTENHLRRVNDLKRLWWCCILRDRTLSLGLQRRIQVAQPCRSPDISVFEDQIGRSLVYDSRTQRRLYGIFTRIMELCAVLTDVLALVCPSDDSLHDSHPMSSSERVKLAECKSALQEWHLSTQSDYPVSREANGFQHQSVMIQTNFMYIFYHTARLSLHRRDVLVNLIQSNEASLSTDKVYETSLEVRDAVTSITDRLRESVQLGIVRYFPISVVAFLAMPLLIHLLDHKMQLLGDRSDKAVANHHRLQALIHAMKQYRQQYHGVENISQVIRFVVEFAEVDCQMKTSGTASDWMDIITCRPTQFIQLTMIMNASLSQAKSPDKAFQQSLPMILSDTSVSQNRLHLSPDVLGSEVFSVHPESYVAGEAISSSSTSGTGKQDATAAIEDSSSLKLHPTLAEKENPVGVAEARSQPGDLVVSSNGPTVEEGKEIGNELGSELLDLADDIPYMDESTSNEFETELLNMLANVDGA